MPVSNPKPALLIVEDDPAALRQLQWTFEDYAVAKATDRPSALQQLGGAHFPVVLLDLGLPPDANGTSEGLAALREILTLAPETKIIVVTGQEGRDCALQAVGLGAYDFYRKPLNTEELRFLVGRAFQLHYLEEENRRLASSAGRELLPEIIGTSESMREVCRLVERAAGSDISVLLVGESGTGKEVLARALHARSLRTSAPLTTINCAAIPESLLESELFGHERGAFTGAVRRSVGRLELAHHGTLFLDEIGDMPLALQAKLLRFLQDKVIQRVGGRTDIPLDVRIMSATHQDLAALVENGAFREDLYYRISELTIGIPPLRERVEDAVVLAQHFFEQFRGGAKRPLQRLAPDAVAAIAHHPWPGNVRELENRMKRAVVMAEGKRVTAPDLDLPAGGTPEPEPSTLSEALRETEHRAVARVWAESQGNVAEASRLLGVSRPTVYKLLREHGLKE
jgi:two-component system NtrC family response regulator